MARRPAGRREGQPGRPATEVARGERGKHARAAVLEAGEVLSRERGLLRVRWLSGLATTTQTRNWAPAR
jgi:hypothetical protein